MKFLLINTNQIVQKLVEITAKKAGANLTTITEYSQLTNLEQYDYILVDDDCFRLDSQTYTDALKDKRKCLIYNKQNTRIEGFDDYVQKPFLPTSILDIFTAQLSKQAPAQNPEKTPLDSADSALGAEFDMALNEENLDNTENAPIELDNLNEGLEEIDNLLDDSLKDTESNLVDSNNASEQEFAEVADSNDESSQTDNAEDKEALLEEPTPDIEAGDELNPEAALDDGLDVELDLSNLDELEDLSDVGDEGDKSSLLQDTDIKQDAADNLEDSKDLENDPMQEADLDNLTKSQNETEEQNVDSAESLDTESLSDLENDDALNLEELDSLAETSEDSPQDDKQVESAIEDLGELENLDTLEDSANLTDKTQELQSSDDLTDLENLQTKDLGDFGELDDLEQEANLDSLAELQESTQDTAEQNIDSLEDLDIESLNDETLDTADKDIQKDTESEDILGDEALELDKLNSLDNNENELDTTQETQDSHMPLDEEFSNEGLLENDLLDNVEKVTLDEPVLDKEQVNEVSKALQSLTEESADFTSLKEPEVAQALGEELPEELLSLDELSESNDESLENMSPDSQDMLESTPAQNNHKQNTQPQEIVKNMIANSVQSSIASLSSNDLKSMLDGLEVTINISFKDKSK